MKTRSQRKTHTDVCVYDEGASIVGNGWIEANEGKCCWRIWGIYIYIFCQRATRRDSFLSLCERVYCAQRVSFLMVLFYIICWEGGGGKVTRSRRLTAAVYSIRLNDKTNWCGFCYEIYIKGISHSNKRRHYIPYILRTNATYLVCTCSRPLYKFRRTAQYYCVYSTTTTPHPRALLSRD